MTDHLDPDRLSDALDRHLPPGHDHVSPDLPDDSAVRAASRLATGPKPMLDPAARARMKAQVMAAVPTIVPGGPRPVIRYLIFALASAAVMVVAMFGLFSALSRSGAGATPTPAAVAVVTETATATDIPPTATDEPTSTPRPPIATSAAATEIPTATEVEPTSTPVPPSATPVPPSSTPTVEPSDTPEPTGAPTDTPTVEPTAEREARLTLEGVVEAIDGRLLTISGLEIELVEDDPLLDVLRVNDRVRIEGELVRGPRLFNIRIETFVLANEDEAANTIEESSEGDLWRDPGDCDNPPPPWAKANGWRARCEGADSPSSSGAGSGQGGPGNNNGQGNPNRPENPGRPESPGNSRGSGNQDDDDD